MPPWAASSGLSDFLQRRLSPPALRGQVQAKLSVSQPGDALEQEADRIADRLVDGAAEPVSPSGGDAGVQRKCAACEEEDQIPILPPAPLRVGPADDAHEREADRVADTVTGGGVAPWIAARPGASGVRRKCETCAEEETLQCDTAANAAGGWTAPPIVAEVLRSPGRPLDTGLRAELEPRFGHDFSTIRVHDDVRAARSARAVSAHAYTVGSDVVFAAGKYAPTSAEGRRLVAHELVHVVQQGATPGLVRRQPAVPQPGDCPSYETGERSTSTTAAGHLDPDVVLLPTGDLLIADFGVDWRHLKPDTATDPLLLSWLARFEADTSYRLSIYGYSDCVGDEGRNTHLRQGRAANVEVLLGPSALGRVDFRGMMALGSYVNDNNTVENRARNRGVVIHFQQAFDFADDPMEVQARPFCGPDVTSWLIGQMNGNVGRVSAMCSNLRYIPVFGLGWTAAALEDFKSLVQSGGPWDFKAHAAALGWLHDATRSCPSEPCNRTVTICGMCFNYDVPGNIHFGWIGRRGCWRPWLLHYGAARAQAGGVDDPRDTVAIDIGIRTADSGTLLCDELRAHRSELNLDNTEGCLECDNPPP